MVGFTTSLGTRWRIFTAFSRLETNRNLGRKFWPCDMAVDGRTGGGGEEEEERGGQGEEQEQEAEGPTADDRTTWKLVGEKEEVEAKM